MMLALIARRLFCRLAPNSSVRVSAHGRLSLWLWLRLRQSADNCVVSYSNQEAVVGPEPCQALQKMQENGIDFRILSVLDTFQLYSRSEHSECKCLFTDNIIQSVEP